MVTAIVIVVFAVIAVHEMIPIMRTGRKLELLLYVTLLSLSFAVLFLATIGITLPGPTGVIKAIVRYIMQP